ncbi:Ldh family oxidoreductase [Acuticoccus sp. M5D2P5]|uniref:Ldh family oxidoreductase n=1 Tax=Acuticoccus kalidii TaxID=2910977 RepID=UPI001F23D80A|nr:Ldh family oxidoreductase [Acuticoccus kalidii]MCF3933428.1 Ldh family oxidoreductase [Acuticoccus kalidii]
MTETPNTIPLRLGADGGDSYRIDADALEGLVKAMLARVGVPEEDGAIVAGSLVGADARGMNSHGMLRLPVYIRRLKEGGFNPVSEAKIVAESPATLVIDGGDGLGSVLTKRAMDMAIERARETGIAAVGIRNSNHNGENAYYVQQAVAQDMIGIATTNGSPIMPVWGGKTPLTGPLPIAIGVPAGTHRPIVLDAALGMSSRGKILYYAEKGMELPEGWLVDADGKPTRDPNWVKNGGWILPIGGHKGFGLILACEILSGLLTGGNFGKELTNLYDDVNTPQKNGHFVIALNIAKFTDLDHFKGRMDQFIDMMKASELVAGAQEILMPGEIEFRKEEEQRANGIVLAKNVLDEVLAAARDLGITVETEGAH